MAQAQFGMIGLGVMGENLALNIEEHGFPVAVWNRPVPAEIVATSVSRATLGPTFTPTPTNVPDSSSPFVAVKVNVPVDVLVARSTIAVIATVI